MNEAIHTILFAQAIGLYLLIIAIIMITRASYYQDILTHLKVGSSTVVVTAAFGLVLGILIVLTHQIWNFESEVLITLIGWILLIKSICWLSFPDFMVKMAHKMYSGWGYYAAAIFTGIIGVILSAHGFYLFMR
jgi:hypothetical protein